MSADKIIADLKKGSVKPVYWLEGDEEFFIDQIMDYAEKYILNESEASFNLTIFYGRDAAWPDVVNTCRKYPMFSDRQVVLLKEAQSMKDIDKLEGYIEHPLPSTILFVGYKNKKVDGRTRLAKLLKEKAVFFSTKKLYEKDLPEWLSNMVQAKGLTIAKKALALMIDHIGNDLSRMSNEIDKLALNLGDRKNITEDDIEKYIGISKEYNVFELQQAIAAKDIYKAMRIIQYFESNPKAAPLPLVFPALYNYFSKVQMVYTANVRDEKMLATAIGVSPWFVKDYITTASRFSAAEVEDIILLLHRYNLRSIGINDPGTEDSQLLKEMVIKMIGLPKEA